MDDRKDKKIKARHEHKLYINTSDYISLVSRVRPIMKLDKNAQENNKYKIRSLYFDNYLDKAVMEKFSGISRREKFRIRLYNDNPDYIRLERKSKSNRLCYKESAILSKEECLSLIDGQYGFLKNKEEKIFFDLYTKMNYQNLRPKAIVDYDREAYIYKAGNVRVTFDTNIRMSNNIRGIFDRDLVTIPAARATILEIKYDGFIPEIIRQIIRIDSRNETEFSKYAVSRLV